MHLVNIPLNYRCISLIETRLPLGGVNIPFKSITDLFLTKCIFQSMQPLILVGTTPAVPVQTRPALQSKPYQLKIVNLFGDLTIKKCQTGPHPRPALSVLSPTPM